MKNITKQLKLISCIICISLLFLTVGCGNNASLVNDANLSDSAYKLGDNMGDYTITDVNGNSYTFSEILKTKKAIVLNFWFINCGPCQMEFPYLQKAYDSYSEDIAVFAINPVDGSEKDIQKYAKQNNLTIPMFVGENTWVTAFSLQGFPTTVVIDRYGTIAFSHMGSITQEGVFEKVFEEFTANGYKQSTYNSINNF